MVNQNRPEFSNSDNGVSLRRLGLDDADDYYDLYDANREHIAALDYRLRDDFRVISQVENQLSPFNSKYNQHFAIMQDDDFVGSTNFRIHRDNTAEITYWVDSGHVRQGIGTTACRMTINRVFATTPIRNVEALIAPMNTPSIRTVEKLGFRINRYLEEDVVYSLDARNVG